MKKYTNGERVIHATEKAYELLYKEQGFKEEKEPTKDKKSSSKKG